MGAGILGITTTEDWDAYRDKNWRRSVQYQFPQGKAPLLGLLSLMDTEEETNDPEYSHFEYRYATPATTTVSQGSSKGPFLTAAGADAGDPVTITAGTSYIILVDDASLFLAGNTIRVAVTTNGATVNDYLIGWITSIDTSTNKITFKAVKTVASVDNGVTNENVGQDVRFTGKAFAEGRSDVSGQVTQLPVRLTNQVQLHRTPITFTGRELKTSLRFDEAGIYTHRSREGIVNHMAGIEATMLWGVKYTDYTATTVDPTTGAGEPTTFTGGILWYLQQWEAQYSVYRGGDGSTTGPAAVTSDADDLKRIITNSTGKISEDTWDIYMERLFRFCNNTTNEKLAFCGNGALRVVNALFKNKTQLISHIPSKEAYGMSVVQHVTPFGTVWYKTHPLFTENPALNNCMLFLDLHTIKYRAMKDRDTQRLKNRHTRGFDGRTDEWFTDAGLELWFPENHMFIQNITGYTP